ncbi:hypothetical protein FDECE_2044 [Fusarium decemcellulare]|nr:hypothetical protein FDECE_2044 [Fusarium decemcellulare]
MDSEIARGMKKKAENEDATVKTDDTEGNIDIGHAHTESHKAKRRHEDVSIHSRAFEFYDEHRDDYQDLEGILNRLQAGEDLGTDRTWLKAYLKFLYSDFLRQYQGTIVTTPIAASAMAFREAF